MALIRRATENPFPRRTAKEGRSATRLAIARTYPDAVNGIAALREEFARIIRMLTPDKVLLEKSAWS